MSRITAINPSEATGGVKELLDAVQAKLGVTPNITRRRKRRLISPASSCRRSAMSARS